MTKKPCFMTRLLAAVLAVVMLFSAVYLAVEADHDCSGEDCAICRQISICENLLKTLGQGDPALHRDDRHADACFSQGKAFELKTGLLQGRSLSVFG